MPTLAKKIVQANNYPNIGANITLPFKGFAVGNPYTNPYTGSAAMLETFWNRQLIPEPLWKEFDLKVCLLVLLLLF